MPKKIILSMMLLLFVCLHQINAYAKEPRMDILKQEPIFSLKMQISGCTYDVRINDVPIEKNALGIPLQATIPINEWLKSGKNQLSIALGPVDNLNELSNMHALCKLKLILQVQDKDQSIDYPITKIHYQSNINNILANHINLSGSTENLCLNSKNDLKVDSQGNVKISNIDIHPSARKFGYGVLLSQTIQIPLRFPTWIWLKSERIPDNTETKDQLITQYEKIWQALNQKNLKPIQALFTIREKELAKAYYTKPAQTNVLAVLSNVMDNKTMELTPFVPKYAYLHVFGDGHLATLTRWTGAPAIAFNKKNGSAHESFGFVFSKVKGKWVVTR